MNELVSPFYEFHKAIELRRKNALKREQNRDVIFSILRTFCIILIIYTVFQTVFTFRIVSGNGMFPSLSDGDLTLTYKQKQYVKNDVVFYDYNGVEYVGRVVAKAGDYIDFSENGTLTVNGTPQTGEIVYPTYPPENWQGALLIPEGYVYILGDNRVQTLDSREIGPVSLDDVSAKVLVLIRHRGI